MKDNEYQPQLDFASSWLRVRHPALVYMYIFLYRPCVIVGVILSEFWLCFVLLHQKATVMTRSSVRLLLDRPVFFFLPEIVKCICDKCVVERYLPILSISDSAHTEISCIILRMFSTKVVKRIAKFQMLDFTYFVFISVYVEQYGSTILKDISSEFTHRIHSPKFMYTLEEGLHQSC